LPRRPRPVRKGFVINFALLLKRFPITIVLVLVSVAATAVTQFGQSPMLADLTIDSHMGGTFSDVMSGQVWRLLTPVFLHFNVLHILFNVLWMWDLGRLIEVVRGPRFYLSFFLLVGIASNLAQYLITANPLFGGLSGVIYGLFGYVWIRSRLDPHFPFIAKNTVIMMLGWYLICWTGLFGAIANWAHTAGLLMGVLWAFLDGMLQRRRVMVA